MTDKRQLTKMQKAFIENYLSDLTANATEAAKKAGYKTPARNATLLLQNPLVEKEIKRRQTKREKQVDLNAEAVLHFLKTGLFFNPFNWLLIGRDGHTYVNDPANLPDEIAQLIEGFEIVEERDKEGNVREIKYKIKFVSKTLLLQMAMKHLNLDGVQKHQITHSIDWDSLYKRKDLDEVLTDPLEEELKLIESKAVGS